MSLRQYVRRPSTICVCGRTKEHPNWRYCDRCGTTHSDILRMAHAGKGAGKRKFGSYKCLHDYEMLERTSRLPL